MLATNIILLLVMLVGLLRLHYRGGGKFGLAQVLWKQVWSRLTLSLVISIIDTFSIHKGVIWFLIATAAEIPPVVGLTSVWLVYFQLSQFHISGVRHFGFGWYFLSPLYQTSIEFLDDILASFNVVCCFGFPPMEVSYCFVQLRCSCCPLGLPRQSQRPVYTALW